LARRLATASLVAPSVEQLYGELGEVPARVSFSYAAAGLEDVPNRAGAEELAALLAPALAAARRADLERRTTTVGPHRDDVDVVLDDRDARTRASQGEQRSVALGLRLAAYRVLAERRSTAPVLLLDDVFSELDARRSARLVERLPQGQVFVTSARSEEVPLVGMRWRVAAGMVTAA
jgi:DNA replication and repair protein RecF